jgi:hypothetical protein
MRKTFIRHMLTASLVLAAMTGAHAGVFAGDPLGGATLAANDPGLRVQLHEPPSPGMVALLVAIGLLPAWPQRRARPAEPASFAR